MIDVSPFARILGADASARLAGGFGYGGAHWHHGHGIVLGSKLVLVGMVAIFGFVLAAMASMSASDWMGKRRMEPGHARALRLVIFLVVVLVLGFGVARLI